MIDKVRQTVMYILGKDNNGYITPDEFNKYADVAQLEIFQEFFARYNDYINRLKMGRMNSGYADLVKQMEQSIDYFTSNVLISKTFTPAVFTVTVDPNDGSIVDIAIIDGGRGYDPNSTASLTLTSSTGPSTPAVVDYEVDSLGNVTNVVITSAGLGYSLVVEASAGNSGNAGSAYSLPDDWYLINAVYYNGKEVQPVKQERLNYLLNSNLTAPTTTYPSYVMIGNSMNIYPDTIDADIPIFYIRYPRTPNWSYTEITNGEPIFNASSPTYQDFEVPQSEFYKLVMKILQYCGVQIRESDVVQYSIAQENITQQTEKQP